MLLLFGVTLRALPRIFRYRRNLAEQLFEIGNASLFMACVLSLFIGGVLALQAGPLLTQRGLGSMLGGLVGASLAKELGPEYEREVVHRDDLVILAGAPPE